MAIIPTNPRDRILGGTAFVAAALVIYYFLQVWQPKRDELIATEAHAESLVVMNQAAKSEMAQGRTAQLSAEAARLSADLEVMRRLVPTGNEVPALLDQVSTAARRVGLEIADVQPLPSLAGDQYEAYKYRLSVRGAYHEIGVLLTNIGSLQRIVAPINLTLVPISTDARAPKRHKVQALEARFEIQTYVARAPLPPPPVKGKPAADAAKPGEK